ncbi:sulfatase-like hydrolase/transferase [Spirosoma telluris]|uniref:sulfatase-like hydrolase/transferase n=1 Tax=Spirosoma telluris TaxID=2183553 RepID=UPI002FC309F5
MRYVFLVLTFISLQTLAQKPSRPNIIFILADDLGYGDIGLNGQNLIKTPNIDRLAAEGMQFPQFYAGTSVCAPSRSSLMTGQHTGHTYIRGNKEVKPRGNNLLPILSRPLPNSSNERVTRLPLSVSGD